MIIIEHLRIYGAKHTPGASPVGHKGGGRAHPPGAIRERSNFKKNPTHTQYHGDA